MEKRSILKFLAIVVVIAFAYLLAYITNFLYWDNIADNLLSDMEMTVGIDPTLFVLLSSFLSIIVGIVLYLIMWNNYFSETLSIFTLLYFIILGISNYVWRMNYSSIIDIRHLSYDKQEKYFIFKNEKDGFSYIGEVNGYDNNNREEKLKIMLFVKSIDGKKHYYALPISWIFDYNNDNDNLEKNLVDTKRGVIETNNNKIYTIEYDFDGVNNYSQNSVGTKEKNYNGESATSHQSEDYNTKPQKTVVEHTRAMQPVQQLQTCYASGGGTIGGSSSTQQQRNQPTRHPCPLCRGNKTIVRESHMATYGNDTQQYCSTCGRNYWASSGHTHITCTQCGGDGYFTTN